MFVDKEEKLIDIQREKGEITGRILNPTRLTTVFLLLEALFKHFDGHITLSYVCSKCGWYKGSKMSKCSYCQSYPEKLNWWKISGVYEKENLEDSDEDLYSVRIKPEELHKISYASAPTMVFKMQSANICIIFKKDHFLLKPNDRIQSQEVEHFLQHYNLRLRRKLKSRLDFFIFNLKTFLVIFRWLDNRIRRWLREYR